MKKLLSLVLLVTVLLGSALASNSSEFDGPRVAHDFNNITFNVLDYYVDIKSDFILELRPRNIVSPTIQIGSGKTETKLIEETLNELLVSLPDVTEQDFLDYFYIENIDKVKNPKSYAGTNLFGNNEIVAHIATFTYKDCDYLVFISNFVDNTTNKAEAYKQGLKFMIDTLDKMTLN